MRNPKLHSADNFLEVRTQYFIVSDLVKKQNGDCSRQRGPIYFDITEVLGWMGKRDAFPFKSWRP